MERYLDDRGINTGLATFVPDYVEFKEQKEYVQWLSSNHHLGLSMLRQVLTIACRFEELRRCLKAYYGSLQSRTDGAVLYRLMALGHLYCFRSRGGRGAGVSSVL